MKTEKEPKCHISGSGGKASQHGESTGGGSTFFKEMAAHAMIKGSKTHIVKKKKGPKSKPVNVDQEQEAEAKLTTELKNSKKREKFGKSNLKTRST